MALPGGFIRLIDSPIRYMQARAASGPPRLFSALVPVVLNAFASVGVVWLFQTRMMPMMPALAGAFLLLSGIAVSMFSFAAHAGIVIMLDMAVAQSRQARRYIELCGLAYWPQAIFSTMLLAAAWLYFDPPVMTIQPDSDMQAAAEAYADDVSGMPFSILTGTLQQFATVWLIALHACTLRVVAGLSAGGAWGAAVALAMVFMGVPWFAVQVWTRLFS